MCLGVGDGCRTRGTHPLAAGHPTTRQCARVSVNVCEWHRYVCISHVCISHVCISHVCISHVCISHINVRLQCDRRCLARGIGPRCRPPHDATVLSHRRSSVMKMLVSKNQL